MVEVAAAQLVADAQSKASAEAATGAAAPGDVRVTYVPQVVRDEITAQVRETIQQTLFGLLSQRRNTFLG